MVFFRCILFFSIWKGINEVNVDHWVHIKSDDIHSILSEVTDTSNLLATSKHEHVATFAFLQK